MIKTAKNIYDKPEPSDGKRLLVMRLWPRGQSKEKLHIQAWLKELGTDPALIKQWKAGAMEWNTFAQAYRKSLKGQEELLKELAKEAKRGTLTLLCSCKDEKHCHRTLLKEAIEKFV